MCKRFVHCSILISTTLVPKAMNNSSRPCALYGWIISRPNKCSAGWDLMYWRETVMTTPKTLPLMDSAGKWALAPAYDVCHAYRPDSPWISQQSLTVNGKRKDINQHDLLEVARQMTIKKPGQIIKQIADTLKLWPDCASQCGVPAVLQRAIAGTFIRCRSSRYSSKNL